jgi:hypothetical protein
MTISDKKKVSLKNVKKYTIKKVAESLSDDDKTDSIDSVVQALCNNFLFLLCFFVIIDNCIFISFLLN